MATRGPGDDQRGRRGATAPSIAERREAGRLGGDAPGGGGGEDWGRLAGASRLNDLAILLPVIAAFAFSPLALDRFVGDATVFGAPISAAFLFASWGGAILMAALLSARMRRAALAEPRDPIDEAER